MHRSVKLCNSLYGKYYNRTHSRTGPVYEGRYKAIPIQDNRYLAAVIRYVHRNPVVAKMCSRVADYRWSSDGAYRYGKTSFIDTAPLLGYLHNDHVLAVKAYCKFMEEEDNGDYEKIAFIGDEAFAMIAEPVKKTIIRTRLDELLAQTGVPFEDISLIKSGSRQRRLMPYKKALVLLAREHGYTFAEIGRFLNISSTAAEKLV